ncbi:MAG: hypothetical protein ACK55Z_02545 [bacterium]
MSTCPCLPPARAHTQTHECARHAKRMLRNACISRSLLLLDRSIYWSLFRSRLTLLHTSRARSISKTEYQRLCSQGRDFFFHKVTLSFFSKSDTELVEPS